MSSFPLRVQRRVAPRSVAAILAGAMIATASFAAPFGASEARAEPKVVASIKPVHSLAAAVMSGVGAPVLIVEGAGSPHAFHMKPSQAHNLQNADAVFWVGRYLESFLVKPMETLVRKSANVELLEAPGLHHLDFGEEDHGDDKHGHEKHGHEKHDEHKEEAHKHDDHKDKHGHDDHKDEHHKDEHHKDEHHKEGHHKDAHGHDGHKDEHGHDHGDRDPHIWLDPRNAQVMTGVIAETLAAIDGANAATYRANAARLTARLKELETQTARQLKPVRGKPFVAFHDAYGHFVRRFGLTQAGVLTVNPDVAPGAKQVRRIRHKIEDAAAVCVFSEPQFPSPLVARLTEGTQARSGTLDPLGADEPDGPNLYFRIVENMTSSLLGCLSPKN